VAKLEQYGLNARDSLLFAARHEAGPVARALDAPARPEVHEVNALLLQPAVAPYRVAPVRVPPVNEDVARVAFFGEVVEDLIDRRSRGDVEEHYSRGSELRLEILVGADLDEPSFGHIGRRTVAREAHHADALLQSLPGEVSPHPTQPNYAVLVPAVTLH
jgi:hypothetical protein